MPCGAAAGLKRCAGLSRACGCGRLYGGRTRLERRTGRLLFLAGAEQRLQIAQNIQMREHRHRPLPDKLLAAV